MMRRELGSLMIDYYTYRYMKATTLTLNWLYHKEFFHILLFVDFDLVVCVTVLRCAHAEQPNISVCTQVL